MAKIYETQQDLQRDTLAHQAKDMRKAQHREIGDSIAGVAISSSLFQIDRLEKFEAKTLGTERGFLSKANKWLAWPAAITAAAMLGLSFHSRSKARAAEARLAALGPEEVILPPDVQAGDSVPLAGNGTHVARLNAEQVVPLHRAP